MSWLAVRVRAGTEREGALAALFELAPTDDSLESVFAYLVGP